MTLAGLSRSPWRVMGAWAAFFALVLGGWAALFAMSADFATRAPVSLLGPGMGLFSPFFPDTSGGLELPWLVEAICLAGAGPSDTAPLALVGMWALMVLAMMAPTAAPVLRTYGDLVAGNPAQVPPVWFFGLLAGFSAVWVSFATLGAAFQ